MPIVHDVVHNGNIVRTHSSNVVVVFSLCRREPLSVKIRVGASRQCKVRPPLGRVREGGYFAG